MRLACRLASGLTQGLMLVTTVYLALFVVLFSILRDTYLQNTAGAQNTGASDFREIVMLCFPFSCERSRSAAAYVFYYAIRPT